jgi:hypothetical protein
MSAQEVSVPVAGHDDPPGKGPSTLADPATLVGAPPPARPNRRPSSNGKASKVAKASRAPKPAPTLCQVRGTVRHIDLWSVFRCSVLIYGSFFLVALVAGLALWIVASATGARHSVEHFIASALLLKRFQFASFTILLAATGIGVVLAAVATGATVAMAGFYNLVSEIVGGIELTVVQEEPAGPVV